MQPVVLCSIYSHPSLSCFSFICTFFSPSLLSQVMFSSTICLSSHTSPRLVTGVPEIIGEQFLLPPYVCFKIKYHMLSNTVKKKKKKKNPHSLLKDKSNLTPSAREMMFFGGPCRKTLYFHLPRMLKKHWLPRRPSAG